MLDEPPVRLCCSQRHNGPVCPDGKVMCQLCYERVSQDKLFTDGTGTKWDVCIDCQGVEKYKLGPAQPGP